MDYVGYYVHDLEFRSVVVKMQTPLEMCLSAALAGFSPPDPERPFTYMDICSGDGTTLNALALLNPESQFYGVDFNPQHIAHARTTAEKYGLKNVHFLEMNIGNLNPQDFPDFDFITINGAYSWLEDPLREKVLDFVGEKLKERGLFYVEYMALPGRVSIAPLWKLIQWMVPFDKFPDGRERAKKGLYYLKLLAKRGMFYLQANPPAARAAQFYLTSTQSDEYFIDHFAHNAMASGFRPMFFYEMLSDVRKRGLDFVGSVDPSLNETELSVPPSQVPTFFEITEPELVETVKDFIRNTMDRRDLFSKNPVKDQAEAVKFLKEKAKLFPSSPLTEIPRVLPIIGGHRIPLKGPVYDKVFELFENGRDYITLEDLGSVPEKQLLKALVRVLATGHFVASLKEPAKFDENKTGKVTIEPEMNRMFLEKAFDSFIQTVLISEHTRGGAVVLNPFEVVAVLSFVEEGGSDSLEEAVSKKIAGITKPIQTLQGQKPANTLNKEEVKQLVEIIKRRKIPLLFKLGILKELC